MMRPGADPFVPDGDEARRWAEKELSDPRYAEVKPTWLDLAARDIADFFASLFDTDNAGTVAPAAAVIVSLIVVAALITALVIWGRPRSTRTAGRAAGDLLGASDDRSAAQLRADAERSARDRDWDAATVLRYRAIARSLLERDLIDPAPGATAQAIAREASAVFPDESAAMRRAAVSFDAVRYLRRPASEEGYVDLSSTDERLLRRRLSAVSA